MWVERANWIKGLGLVILGVVIGIAMPGQPASSAKEARRIEPPRIGYANIARVLRDFERANQEGQRITDRRAELVKRVNDDRGGLARINKEYEGSSNAAEKAELKHRAVELNKRIEATDAAGQTEIEKASNAVIVEIHDQIRSVAEALAKDRGLDVLECFPGEWRPDHQRTPEVARLMLQTPGLMPFYLNPDLDFTNELVERLNKKYPPK